MGLFGKRNKNKNEENHTVPIEQQVNNKDEQKDSTGSFAGFALLSEPVWDKEQFISDLKEEWDIDISEQEDNDENDMIYADACGFRIVIGLIPSPVPNGEAEHFAKANYMWKDAVDTVETHKAHLLICILGDDSDVMEKGRLFVKVASAALKQENAIAFYSEGAVYEPEMYIKFSRMIKDDEIPILNLIWFGIYSDGKKAGIYTFGMRRFGKEEIEVYVDADKADLGELRDFVLSVSVYVLDGDVTLKDGETIGFSAEQKLPITVSKGIAVDGDTIKIDLG